jgi:hypothetical protein
MMLVEVGLPLGAEVDRSSLDKVKDDPWLVSWATKSSPVVSLGARARGPHFAFAMRARFPMEAQTPPTRLCDYYNAEVPPTRIVVH